MTKTRVVNILLLSGTLTLMGCGHQQVNANPVISITNCVANPDSQDVPDGGQVSWSDDGTVYEIVFDGKDPIPPPVISGKTYTANGGFWCKKLHLGCYYKYRLKKNSVICSPDPGIRIIP